MTAVLTEREAQRQAWQAQVDGRIRRITAGLETYDGEMWRCVHETGSHMLYRGYPCEKRRS